jgi:hypothetical protein
MSIGIIFYLLFAHWIGDFVLQTHKQAHAKSVSNYWLTSHIINYTAFMVIAMFCMQLYLHNVDLAAIGTFGVITFWCHWLTDYCTSRLNSWLWKRADTHNFFVSVGFDQILHYIQLILTIKYLLL